jgi:hypothetical protein
MLRNARTAVLAATVSTSALLLFTAPAARAQTEGPGRFKLTFGFPTDGDTSDVTGNPIFGFGLSGDLPSSVVKGGPAVVSFYLDSIYSHKTKNSISVDLSYVGFGPAVRFYPGRKAPGDVSAGVPPKPNQFYLGLGFGAYFTRFRLRNEFTNTTTDDSSGVKFGGKVQAGVDIGKVGFIEVEYQMPGVSQGNTINLNFGARFGGHE